MPIKFGIIIPTYPRLDGSTWSYLNRCYASILNQTYQNYEVFTVFDGDIDNELDDFLAFDRFTDLRLPFASERHIDLEPKELWHCGGVNANNYGLYTAYNDPTITHICHMDDDDWWEPNHLEALTLAFRPLSQYPVVAAFTAARYTGDRVLPNLGVLRPIVNIDTPIVQENHYPGPQGPPVYIRSSWLLQPENICHSAVAWDAEFFRNMYYEPVRHKPADAHMYDKLGLHYLRAATTDNSLRTAYINKVTVHHEEEKRILNQS